MCVHVRVCLCAWARKRVSLRACDSGFGNLELSQFLLYSLALHLLHALDFRLVGRVPDKERCVRLGVSRLGVSRGGRAR